MTNIASLLFHGSILDLINPEACGGKARVQYRFENQPSIKDAIESLGPPHTEIIAITVNNQAIGFDYLLRNSDKVEVFAFDTNPTVAQQDQLPNRPEGEPRFILDVHLGGLARYLRFAGFDTLYSSVDPGDQSIADVSRYENRVALSRDVGLLKRSIIQYGYWLRHTQTQKQFSEVAKRYNLKVHANPFSRCTLCNGLIERVEKHPVINKLPPRVGAQFNTFWQCKQCQQIYWKGSHYQKIKKCINDLLL